VRAPAPFARASVPSAGLFCVSAPLGSPVPAISKTPRQATNVIVMGVRWLGAKLCQFPNYSVPPVVRDLWDFIYIAVFGAVLRQCIVGRTCLPHGKPPFADDQNSSACGTSQRKDLQHEL
jgi:hypothetical protein